MKSSRLLTFLLPLAVVIAAGPISNLIGQVRELPRQDTDKSLDIERYSNEPLELIDLKVGEQALNDKITIKSRNGDAGLDTVNFRERNGWFKSILITMRNVSGRSIYGIRAFLYFAPPGSHTLYSLPLLASPTLKQGVVEPGAEITLTVSDQAWSLTSDIFEKHGVDPNCASVEFSLALVQFANDLQWSKGKMLRRDPNNPNRWNVIDMKIEPSEIGNSHENFTFCSCFNCSGGLWHC